MSAEVREESDGGLVHVNISGKLSRKDYEVFVPVIERLISEQGKVRMLIEMHDFHGWTAAALWEDIKFDAKHYADIERLALVGEGKWEKGMSVFCRPFTSAAIRYFDTGAIAEARAWVLEQGD